MGAPFSFVHVKTETKAQGPVTQHAAGERRPDSALTRAEWGHRSVVPILEDLQRAENVTREVRQAPGRSGRPGAERVRLLIGHPPRFEGSDAWDRDKLLTWARASTEWVKKGVERATKGTAVVESAYLHVDELRPHLHVSVVPSVRDAKNPAGHLRMSWYRIQAAWSGAGGKVGLSKLQTSYFRDVGRGFGMRRGEPSDRRRAAIDDTDALKTRVRLVEERARERSALERESVERARRLTAIERNAGRNREWKHKARSSRDKRELGRAVARADRAEVEHGGRKTGLER